MRLRSLAIAAALAALPVTGAHAEPQVLALLATDSAKSLTCEGGQCQAEFSSFCMEKPRKSPVHNTAYAPIQGADDLRIVAETVDGRRVPISSEHLRFASKRGFAAVRVSIDESVLQSVGAARIAVHVGPRVALQPVAAPHYRDPHEPAEIAAAIGHNRKVGEAIVDRGGVNREIADVVSRLINALPADGVTTSAQERTLWQDVIQRGDPLGVSDSAISRARDGYRQCLQTISDFPQDTLAFCLGRLHDQQIWPLTKRYWRRSIGS